MNIRHFITAATLVAASATSFAQNVPQPIPAPPPAATPDAARGTHTPVIDKRETHQDARIKEGRQSGEITKHEARRLKAEQKAIDRAEHRAAADGTVTAKERSKIRHMQDRAGKDISRQKNDGAKTEPAGK